MKFLLSLTVLVAIFIGHQGVQGLQCYTCTAESKEKCHYARSGDGTGDKNSWFGDLTTCSDSEDHCMTARTQYAEYEWTYIRGCVALGNEVDEINKCHTYPGESTETTVCFCSKDECNGGQNLLGFNITMMFLMTLLLKIFV